MGTRPGSRCGRSQHTPPGVLLLIGLPWLGLCLLGCAKAMPGNADPVAWNAAQRARADLFEVALDRSDEAPLAPGSLRIGLAFGGGADLDLYVTDPLHETVYFGNSPSSDGGVLARDLRCDAQVPRVETVTFPEARAGGYRVGVDYPESCSPKGHPVAFVIRIDFGADSQVERRLIEPLRFQAIVHEFEIDARQEE